MGAMSLRRTGIARKSELRRTNFSEQRSKELNRRKERNARRLGRDLSLLNTRVHACIDRRGDNYDPEVRFWAKVRGGTTPKIDPSLGPCMVHSGADNGNGYVQFRYNGQGDYAHRYAWERVHGPIPAELTIDHLCEVKRCVNVDHLALATRVDNYLRTALAKTHCPNGHEYVEGSHRRDAKLGTRECLICLKAQMRRSWSRRSRSQNGLPNRRIKYDQEVVRQVIAEIRAAELTIAAGARRIGCTPAYLGRRVWEETRRDVLARDERRCGRCSNEATDAHHRIARGSGGSAVPRISFGLDNLISLCRLCHSWVHEHPEAARGQGWILKRHQDPSAEPVAMSGRRVFLTVDGDYLEVAA